MKAGAGYRAGARDIAGILGNFGFHHDNVKCGQKESFLSIRKLIGKESPGQRKSRRGNFVKGG